MAGANEGVNNNITQTPLQVKYKSRDNFVKSESDLCAAIYLYTLWITSNLNEVWEITLGDTISWQGSTFNALDITWQDGA